MKNKTRKKEFVRILNELVSIKKAEDDLRGAYKNFDKDIEFRGCPRYEDLLIDTLTFAMHDSEEWIIHWVYEMDCGRRDDLKVAYQDKDVPMKTPGQLYNWLVTIYK